MSEPSKYFRQHHVVEAPAIGEHSFRPFWRVRTRLDQLHDDHAISFTVWRAGMSFRILAELVLTEQWSTKWLEYNDRPAAFDIAIQRRLDALDKLRMLRNSIGGFAVDLLEAHIVDDLPWRELGRQMGVHGKTARTWTIEALRLLASVIGGIR